MDQQADSKVTLENHYQEFAEVEVHGFDIEGCFDGTRDSIFANFYGQRISYEYSGRRSDEMILKGIEVFAGKTETRKTETVNSCWPDGSVDHQGSHSNTLINGIFETGMVQFSFWAKRPGKNKWIDCTLWVNGDGKILGQALDLSCRPYGFLSLNDNPPLSKEAAVQGLQELLAQ